MNKVVLAGLAAAFLGAFSAPVSNAACETLHTSSFVVSSPVTVDACDPCATRVLEKQVVAPVLVERELTAPVVIDRSLTLPAVIDRPVTMPVIIEHDDPLIRFDSPILRFGLF